MTVVILQIEVFMKFMSLVVPLFSLFELQDTVDAVPELLVLLLVFIVLLPPVSNEGYRVYVKWKILYCVYATGSKNNNDGLQLKMLSLHLQLIIVEIYDNIEKK